MAEVVKCTCNNDGICDRCKYLLKAKKSKKISVIEKFKNEYEKMYGIYMSYGQFVAMIDGIHRRKTELDNRRKKESTKKVRRN